MQEYQIYIFLTRSGTWFSRLIHIATNDSYTHASIGLDGPTGTFYSFARKNPRFALPAGLVAEKGPWDRGESARSMPCCLYEMTVSEQTYLRLRERINEMYATRDRYGYNILGAVTCFFNYPLRRENHYFCSQFVASLLQDSGAVALPKPPTLLRPSDFCGFDGMRAVHRGDLSGMPATGAAV